MCPSDHWRPSISIKNLKARAKILTQIRNFFAAHDVMEVETPVLSRAAVTDLHLRSFKLSSKENPPPFYLHTSPEFAMKRLLAAGSGSIYQIAKVFREGESGRFHNPEFTLLEWYRLGWTYHELMDEVDSLLQLILKTKSGKRETYQALFKKHLDINPHSVPIEQLQNCISQYGLINISGIDYNDRDILLQLLMSHCIEPNLGMDCPCFVVDYPASQAALAKIRYSDYDDFYVAERFEVYVKGIELANGFQELCDAEEQAARFQGDLQMRDKQHLPKVPIDNHFLDALKFGLPECAGVALGIDRLVLLALKENHINNVISFPIDRV